MDVARERLRQMRKWGEQNHPLGMGPNERSLEIGYDRVELFNNFQLAKYFTESTNNAAGMINQLTWRDILLEEVFELLAEGRADKVREEAIQVAAVAVAIVEYVDRTRDIEDVK